MIISCHFPFSDFSFSFWSISHFTRKEMIKYNLMWFFPLSYSMHSPWLHLFRTSSVVGLFATKRWKKNEFLTLIKCSWDLQHNMARKTPFVLHNWLHFPLQNPVRFFPSDMFSQHSDPTPEHAQIYTKYISKRI